MLRGGLMLLTVIVDLLLETRLQLAEFKMLLLRLIQSIVATAANIVHRLLQFLRASLLPPWAFDLLDR